MGLSPEIVTLQLALSVRGTCALVSTTVKYGRIWFTSKKSASGGIYELSSTISNMKENGKDIEKAVYTPLIQAEVAFGRGATSPTGKMIIKSCNERLRT